MVVKNFDGRVFNLGEFVDVDVVLFVIVDGLLE